MFDNIGISIDLYSSDILINLYFISDEYFGMCSVNKLSSFSLRVSSGFYILK